MPEISSSKVDQTAEKTSRKRIQAARHHYEQALRGNLGIRSSRCRGHDMPRMIRIAPTSKSSLAKIRGNLGPANIQPDQRPSVNQHPDRVGGGHKTAASVTSKPAAVDTAHGHNERQAATPSRWRAGVWSTAGTRFCTSGGAAHDELQHGPGGPENQEPSAGPGSNAGQEQDRQH